MILFCPIMSLRKGSNQLHVSTLEADGWGHVIGHSPESYRESRMAMPDRMGCRTKKIKYLTPQKINYRLEL